MKQENPKLGRESSVTQVGMDAVYQFATAPRAETGMQGVIFRFMPDPMQVDAAVKVRTVLRCTLGCAVNHRGTCHESVGVHR